METTDTEGSLPVNLDIVKEEYSVQDEVAFVGEVQDDEQDKEVSLERTQFIVEEVEPNGRRKCTYCCPKCPKTFPARNNLTIHMKVHRFHDSLTCVTCGKTFKNRRRLLAHLKTHHDAKFECKECGKKFKSRTSMKPHILKVHHGMSDFEVSGKKLTCTVCREVFPTDWKYEKHRRTSHGGIVDVAPPIVEFVMREGVGDEGAFPCPKCPKVFRAQKFLGSHLRVHSDDQLVCETCGKTFEERLSLVEHLKSHEAPKFACKECGQQFDSRASIKPHMLMVHYGLPEFNVSDEKFTCNLCGKEFDAKKKLESHWFYHTAIRKHECPACGKKFKTLPALRTHYKFVHTDERPFVCNICGDAFKKRPDLRNHGLTHMELKVFDRIPCKLCGKTFKRPVYLKNHLRIYHAEKMECEKCGKKYKSKESIKFHIMHVHLGMSGFEITGKRFKCEECGKEFFLMKAFRNHLYTHSKTRDFQCPQCPKSFKTKYECNHHERNIHAAERLACTICSKTFKVLLSLRNHMKKKHSSSSRGSSRLGERKSPRKHQEGCSTASSSSAKDVKEERTLTEMLEGHQENQEGNSTEDLPKDFPVNPFLIKREKIDEEEGLTNFISSKEIKTEFDPFIKPEKD